MKKIVLFALSSILCLNILGAVTNTSIKAMMNVWDKTTPGYHNIFALTGTVHTTQAPENNTSDVSCFVIENNSLLISIFNKTQPHIKLKPGDHIIASGIFGLKKYTYGNEPYAIANEIKIIQSTSPTQPVARHLKDLTSFNDNLRLIKTSGTIIDWRESEDDPNYIYLTLKDGSTTMPVIIPSQNEDTINKLIDSQVSLVGIFNWALASVRRYARPLIVSKIEDIKLLSSPTPPENIPHIERKIYQTPESIRSLGKRKISGEIIAVWQKCNLLIQDDDGRIVRVNLSHRNAIPPKTGQYATIVGYPETDQFNIILGTATISSSTTKEISFQSPINLPSLDSIINKKHHSQSLAFNPSYYGKLITIKGTIRSLPSLGNADGRIVLDCDGHLIQLDTSACPQVTEDLELGCQIQATGVCLLETNEYDTQTDMPHISALTIVIRNNNDITILSCPPWLTSKRFIIILSIMTGLLILVLFWNASLRILAERRARELAKKQVEATNAKFKTIERTRLATELHDSVVQNLTGAAMEIRAAKAALATTENKSSPHLEIALKTINSSRTELRNCIWDLRNQALEKSDIEEAIRITLKPHLFEAQVQINFNIPRRTIPDNEFHNILCIIRELSINAERHGKASILKIEGSINGKSLHFSVTDNGCGFEPSKCHGMEQGHFGLEGVFERVKALNGKTDIVSTIGKGTNINIHIPLPNNT